MNKTQDVTVSHTGALRERTAQLRAQGRPITDLTAGELAMPTPQHILEAAVAAARDPRLHSYGPAAGEPEFRAAIAERMTTQTGQAVNSDNVAVTNGAKQAIFNALRALLEPGDEVIIPAPYWVTFPSSVRLAGGRPVILPVHDDDLLGSAERLEEARTPRTKATILVSPHNPTGLIRHTASVEAILRWAVENDIWLIVDDTYVDLAFAPVPRFSAMAADAGAQVVSIGSTSKSFAMTGWRTGWLTGPREVVQATIAIQSHTASNVCRIAQAAAIAALTGPNVPEDIVTLLRVNRARALEILGAAPVSLPKPEGAFYVFPDIRPSGWTNDVAFAERLLEQDVAVVPGTAFGCPGHVRISYAGKTKTFADALITMARLLATGPSSPHLHTEATTEADRQEEGPAPLPSHRPAHAARPRRAHHAEDLSHCAALSAATAVHARVSSRKLRHLADDPGRPDNCAWQHPR